MTEKSAWRRLIVAMDRAREELWDAEAKAQNVFFIALRSAVEEYAREVDPDSFNQYGQSR